MKHKVSHEGFFKTHLSLYVIIIFFLSKYSLPLWISFQLNSFDSDFHMQTMCPKYTFCDAENHWDFIKYRVSKLNSDLLIYPLSMSVFHSHSINSIFTLCNFYLFAIKGECVSSHQQTECHRIILFFRNSEVWASG